MSMETLAKRPTNSRPSSILAQRGAEPTDTAKPTSNGSNHGYGLHTFLLPDLVRPHSHSTHNPFHTLPDLVIPYR